MKKLLYWVPVLFIFFAALPLFQPGFIPTHDGEYHIIRISEFLTMLESGYWFPRWAPNLNSGYGMPLFNFHYPLPNYIGSFFHIFGFSFPDAFKLTLAAGYGAASFFCFLWLKKQFSRIAAAVGTVTFAFVPYWFVDMYVRGSVGEVIGLAWVMCALWAISSKRFMLVSIAIAGMIVSHNIITLLFFPFLFLYALLNFQYRKSPKFVLSFILGLMVSSYFWIPALLERGFVTGLNAVAFQDHFPDLLQLLIPSWGTGFSGPGHSFDELSFQIGIVPVSLIILTFFVIWKERNKEKKQTGLFFLFLILLSVFLMLDYSVPIWKLIPVMQYIQYPWRLLSFIIPITPFLAAYTTDRFGGKWGIGLAFAAVVVSFSYSRPVIYLPRNDWYYLSRPEFTDGTSSMGNSFSTVWTGWKKERSKKKAEFLSGNGNIITVSLKPLRYDFKITAREESRVRVNTLYFPGWKVMIDGKEALIDYKTNGTIDFSVSQGNHAVLAEFQETKVRLAADMLSVSGLFCFVGWAILRKLYK